MKEDESPDPVCVGDLGSPAVVPRAYGVPHLIEKLWAWPVRDRNHAGSLKGIGHTACHLRAACQVPLHQDCRMYRRESPRGVRERCCSYHSQSRCVATLELLELARRSHMLGGLRRPRAVHLGAVTGGLNPSRRAFRARRRTSKVTKRSQCLALAQCSASAKSNP